MLENPCWMNLRLLIWLNDEALNKNLQFKRSFYPPRNTCKLAGCTREDICDYLCFSKFSAENVLKLCLSLHYEVDIFKLNDSVPISCITDRLCVTIFEYTLAFAPTNFPLLL